MWAKSRSRIAANVWPTGGGIGSTQPWGRRGDDGQQRAGRDWTQTSEPTTLAQIRC